MEAIVKDMTESMIKKNIKYNNKRNFTNTAIFLPAILIARMKNKADRLEEEFWVEVNTTFPELKRYNQSTRKDYSIVYTEYKAED